MTDLDPTPKPCPFCGSDTIEPRSMPLITLTLHCYQCQTCGGTSGSSNTRLTALAIWNRRANTEPVTHLTVT